MGERATHIVVVDDHRLFGAALATALVAEGFSVTVPELTELTDLADLGRIVLREAPDVILLDLDLGSVGSGESLLGAFVGSGAAVLVVSGTTDDATIGRCLDQGAAGWMSKCAPFEQLLESVRAVAAGGEGPRPTRPLPAAPRQHPAAPVTSFDWLTARESAVLAMLMDGQTVARISAACYVSEATVRTQVRAVLHKLGVNSQLEAVALATRAGWSLTAATTEQGARRHRSLRVPGTARRASRRVGSVPSVGAGPSGSPPS
jgi:two-component system, NarL family, nitrate/nitrite response regulator NarL